MLFADGLTKNYGSFCALENVSIRFLPGRIHAILGENGAGKSTLIKILSGAHLPNDGKLVLEGQSVRLSSPAQAEELGIGCVHQEAPLLTNLSVGENLLFGHWPKVNGLINKGQLAAKAKAMMAPLGLDIDPDAPLGSLSIGTQHLISIARAISQARKVLILDEPTASLDRPECQKLFAMMKSATERGMAVIFITHFLDQVFQVSDHITILRNGQFVASVETKNTSRAEIVPLMLGAKSADHDHDGPAQKDKVDENLPANCALNALSSGPIGPISIALKAGEIVGLAGLLGSGRSETALMAYGAQKASGTIHGTMQGTIEVRGKAHRPNSPQKAMKNGLALLAEDRKRDGIFPSLSVRENIMIGALALRGWARKLSAKAVQAKSDELAQKMDVRAQNLDVAIESLSGGNQQKALIARTLAQEPALLMLDEPTRGVDIGAHADILAHIKQMAQKGMSLLLISSEVDELVGAAHRVIILRDGKQGKNIADQDVTAENLIAAIANDSPKEAA